MNSLYLRIFISVLAIIGLSPLVANMAAAKRLNWSIKLGTDEVRCFDQIYPASQWNNSHSEEKMLADAKVASGYLNRNGRRSYFFLIEGERWCGTAGCKLLIGEVEQAGICRLLYDDDGSDNIDILQRRDHGYRRLYTPCEARFDGQQYQQLHPECPTVDIQR